jgi:hypothetical protein
MGNCNVVSGLAIGLDGIISVSTSCSVEMAASCDGEPLEGPATHSVNITGYASNAVWNLGPAKAGVNISFIRKYGCDSNEAYLIFAGQGQSYEAGPIGSLASVNKAFSTSSYLSANASSGPSSVYLSGTQTAGYGLSYSGGPFSFDTANGAVIISLGGMLGGNHYLQSFSVDAQCGQLPVATYSFIAPMRGT